MRRWMMWGLLLCAIGALTPACGDTTTPAKPTPTPVTEPFSGTLTTNGAFTHQFSVTAAGTVTVTLTTVSPDATVAIGFQLGTWNSISLTCQAVISNDAALQGAVETGNAVTAGTFCVRIYDATGTVKADTPVNYTVTVTHP
jgi:hypothetical protein